MKTIHPFFIIGSVGVIVVSVLHIFLALGLGIITAHHTFFILYPIFISFMAIGFGILLKDQKNS